MELAFAGIGAAFGGVVAGAAGATAQTVLSAIGLGWMAGTFIYNLLFTPTKQSYGPRLKDKDVQVSTYGTAIPIIYGVVKVAGNIIWMDEIKEHKSTQNVGKGGGGSTITTYWYSCSFAVAFCEGEIESLLKIWLDDKLVYNVTSDNDKVTKDSTLNFKFYNGSETQLPDPTIQAIKGVNDTPAYRGICYIVLKNLKLTRYGNRLPNVRVLVGNTAGISSGLYDVSGYTNPTPSVSYPAGMVATQDDMYIIYGNYYYWDDPPGYADAYVWRRINTYTRQVVTEKVYYPPNPCSAVLESICGNSCLPFGAYHGFDVDELGNVYAVSCEERGYMCRLDSETFTVQAVGPEPAYNIDEVLYPDPYPVVDLMGAYIRVSRNPNYPYLWTVTEPDEDLDRWGVLLLNRDTLANPFDATSRGHFFPSPVLTYWLTGIAVNDNDGSCYAYCVGADSYVVYLSRYYPDGSREDHDVSSQMPSTWNGGTGAAFAYDADSNQLIITFGIEGYYNGVAFFDATTFTLNGHVSSANIDGFAGTNRLEVHNGVLFLYDWGVGLSAPWTIVKIDVTTYEILDSYDEVDPYYVYGAVYIPYKDSLYIQVDNDDNDELKELLIGRMSVDTITLSDIVEDICNRCDLSDSELNTTQLIDEVDGYLIDNVISGVESIRPLSQAYLFDGTEVDGYLQFIKRGQPPAATIVEDELSAHPDGDERPAPLKQKVIQEVELPQEISIQYFDVDANQEVGAQLARKLVTSSVNKIGLSLPVVMSHDRAKQLAEIMLQWAWTGRVAFEFSIGMKYMYLIPTDVVMIQKTEATYQAMITDMSLEGNLIRCQAVQDYETVYSSTASGTALPIPDDGIDWAGPSIWYLLDLPPLQDTQGASTGFYGVGNGYTDAWLGCSIWRKDANTGNWNIFIDVNKRGITGLVTNVLPVFDYNIFDCRNTLTVRLDYEHHQLESCTEAELFSGYVNYALVGNEIIQYQNAVENSDGTWTLSKLLRGRRGTEWAMATHTIGEKFIVLAIDTTFWSTLSSDYLDYNVTFHGVTHGDDFSEGIDRVYAPTFATLRPWSVVHTTFATNSVEATISWIRRNRYNNNWMNSVEVPMSETTESYALDFYTGATVTMTKTVSSTTCTVSMTSMSGLTSCIIHQVSDVVGNGWGTEVIF